jgi:hypothetical protein
MRLNFLGEVLVNLQQRVERRFDFDSAVALKLTIAQSAGWLGSPHVRFGVNLVDSNTW